MTKTKSEYEEKRDFSKTKEPQGGTVKGNPDNPSFVIQKHDATNLHYDFRLEIDGVLKSWAVPKGPSIDPSVKRMAIPTEDHPLEYGNFEGTIPEGEYGGGTVMIWDTGTFKNLKKTKDDKEISLTESYKMGTLEFWLQGKKLQGGYALIKMKKGPMKDNWLLIKMNDSEANSRQEPASTQNNSAVTGRTMAQIAKEEGE
ncbi:MAG TPA: DNA polymerase ligase N-terminal domain-containing protein [Flavobacteriaceae bacterium]|nr:DNA polymerase ligase N-terminal domain-containing protein [Flavobacteriaceae bacterium]